MSGTCVLLFHITIFLFSACRPDEFRLVRVIQRHEQLSIFSDVAHKVFEAHEQTVCVHRAEQGLTPHFQVLKSCLLEQKAVKWSKDRLAATTESKWLTASNTSWNHAFSSWILSSTLREAVSCARNRLTVLVRSGSRVLPASSRTTRSNPNILSSTHDHTASNEKGNPRDVSQAHKILQASLQ